MNREPCRVTMTCLRSLRCACGALALAAVALTAAGCGRALTIHQDRFVNTGAQGNRPPEKRTGEPLELTIVCVYPPDVEKPGNELLKPDSKITVKDWYDRRPTTSAAEPGKFNLSQNQIFLLTNDTTYFGRKIGNAIRGAALDGDAPIKKGPFEYKWGDLHDQRGTIYVFPKFIGKDGGVLPLPPARLHPPGAYPQDTEVKIGVEEGKPVEAAQYIRVLTERKTHGKE